MATFQELPELWLGVKLRGNRVVLIKTFTKIGDILEGSTLIVVS